MDPVHRPLSFRGCRDSWARGVLSVLEPPGEADPSGLGLGVLTGAVLDGDPTGPADAAGFGSPPPPNTWNSAITRMSSSASTSARRTQ